MSLLVKTNFPLPIGIMAGEYERILRKRIEMVGGNRQDPQLDQMLEYFKEHNLPDHVKGGRGSVRKARTFQSSLCLVLVRSRSVVAQSVAFPGFVPPELLCGSLFTLRSGLWPPRTSP